MADFVISELVEKRIKKKGNQWCVVSEDGKRNLGCGPSKDWATKRLAEVEYFKHEKSIPEAHLGAHNFGGGEIEIDPDELLAFVAKQNQKSLSEKHFPGKHDQGTHAGKMRQKRPDPYKASDADVTSAAKELVKSFESQITSDLVRSGRAKSKKQAADVWINQMSNDVKLNYVADTIPALPDSGRTVLAEFFVSNGDRDNFDWKSVDYDRGDFDDANLQVDRFISDNIFSNQQYKKSMTEKHFPTAACPKCGSTVEDPHIGRGTHKCSKCGHEYQPHNEVEKARQNYLLQKSLFVAAVEKHLPGKHDQQSHAGYGQSHLSDLKKFGPGTRAGRGAGRDLLRQLRQSSEIEDLTPETQHDINSAVSALSRELDKPRKIYNYTSAERDAWRNVIELATSALDDIEFETDEETKSLLPKGYHRFLYQDELREIGQLADDGSEDHKIPEVHKKYNEIHESKQKHLPGKHDQSSHGRTRTPRSPEFTKMLSEHGFKYNPLPIRGVDLYESTTGNGRNQLEHSIYIADSGKWEHHSSKGLDIYGRGKGSDFKSLKAYLAASRHILEEKHLPGQHDQSSHAGIKGASGKVAHTSAQLRDAAARQYAKDNDTSIAAAKKKVGGGAKVPTTRKVLSNRTADERQRDQKILNKLSTSELHSRIDLAQQQRARAKEDLSSTKDPTARTRLSQGIENLGEQIADYQDVLLDKVGKSLISKADQSCLKAIWSEYYKYYSGKWIAQGWNAYHAGKYSQAADAFEKARDGFQPNKNPKEYECLDAWRADAEEKSGGEQKHLPGKHDQSTHGHSNSLPGEHVIGVGEGTGNQNAFQKVAPTLSGSTNNNARRRYNSDVASNKMLSKLVDRYGTAIVGDVWSHLSRDSSDKDSISEAKKHLKNYYALNSKLADKILDDFSDAQVKKSQTLVPISFSSDVFRTEWRITKARIKDDGMMEWEATTTKFDRDIEGDKVTKAFYEEAIRRFKSKTVPPPFASVAHYSLYDCDCGYEFKSLTDYLCPKCGTERLSAGIATDIWIDGRQPKARGIFFPTALGRQLYQEVKSDIQNKIPHEDCIRISMGFYPDSDGVIKKSSNQRDFLRGWIEHFAFTRVPVVAETLVSVS